MKNYFNFNFEKKAIVGSKTAIRKANAGNTPEYKELCHKLAEHPDFKVIQKDIERNETKKKYSGLTFDRMKDYILTQKDSENKLVLFEKVQEIAEAKGAKYPLTKKWFLKTYPEYKENEAKVLEEKKLEEQAKAEIESLIDEDVVIEELASYLAAWRKYWKNIRNGHSNYDAIYKMRNEFGGVARKHIIPEISGFYHREIELLCNLIQGDIEKELERN